MSSTGRSACEDRWSLRCLWGSLPSVHGTRLVALSQHGASPPTPPPNLQPNGALAPAHNGTALSHTVICRGALLVLEMPLGKDLGFVLCDRRQRFGVTELWLWGSPSVCGRFQNVPHLLPWHWGGGSDALDAVGM